MKTFKMINTLILIILIIIDTFYIGKTIINGELTKILDNGILFLMLWIPFLTKKILKVNLSELFKFLYYIYIIVTILVGEIIGLTEYTLWFDKIVHCYFGFFTAIVAVFFLKCNKINFKEKIFFNILFIIGFTLLIANGWEFIEYTSDKIFHTNHQRWQQTGVDDTMLDLLVAFLGSIIVSINYFIEIKIKKPGLVFNSIREDNNILKK